MKHRLPLCGFALVSTLAILVIVTILLVAFATVMRTERAASQNFVDRSRAEAIGMGMINRILAEHAAPVGDRTTGEPVKPFEVDPTTGLPTQQASEDYFAATGYSATTGPDVPIDFDRPLLQPIYQMVPDDDDEFEETGLVRTSRPASGGDPAYSEEFWAYDGLTPGVLGSRLALPGTVPHWVDYYQPDDPSTPEDESEYPVAQVAFAIWDEGGKFDVNMVGADTSVNGIAPHDLKIEEILTEDNGADLFAYLNNEESGNGERDRNNFSLRNIVSKFHPNPGSGSGLPNDQGDDRWVFSVRELIQRDLIEPNRFRMVTTSSRDFDVRPEWNADRAPSPPGSSALGAQDFLRSYINNPALYRLFYGAGAVGPSLVWNNLNEEELSSRLQSDGASLTPPPSGQYKADWMQVMRLLAVLRRAMPPYDGAPPSSTDLALNVWNSHDIWATGLNLIQASAPPSDHNLFAYNPDAHPKPHDDPNVRIGNRLSPLITEVAVKMTKVQGQNSYQLTQYFKLWNPYPFELTHNGEPIRYRLGNYTYNVWPVGTSSDPGIWNLSDRKSRVENITAPPPGQFKVVRFRPSDPITAQQITNNRYENETKVFRIRPYLQIMDYTREFRSGDAYADRQSAYLCLQMGTFYARSGAMNQYDQLLANIGLLPAEGEPKWYSFQIDDPRMGSVKRNTGIYRPRPNTGPSDAPYPQANDNFKWSWLLYHKQALQDVPIVEDDLAMRDAREVSVSAGDPDMSQNYNGKTLNGTPGYNRNFGINWPGADPVNGVTSEEDFAKMMATFALPGRPLLNIGELGTVFANRPWVTLNFANKIIPDSNILGASVSPSISDPPANNAALLRPAAILDYFTTIGTPNSMDFDNPSDDLLRYMDPAQFAAVSGRAPAADAAQFQQDKRYQDKTWLFESLAGGSTVDNQIPDGNLRPVRGRINLNTASTEVLTTLLKAPYRMPASLGLELMGASQIAGSDPRRDYLFTVQEADAQAMAEAITLPVNHGQAIRPLRMLSDLSQLYDRNPTLMKSLYEKYPQSVISAMIGRLAQFGTVRQQSYTIDMVVRTLNPAVERNRGSGDKRVITGEARLQARVFFDSFSRQAFIESVEYK